MNIYIKRVLYDTEFMEAGVAINPPKEVREQDREQTVSPRVLEAATCIKELLSERGWSLDDLDPLHDFNPDVRRLVVEDSEEPS